MKSKTLEKITEKGKAVLDFIPTPVKLSALSFALGAGLGRLGKSTNEHWIPAAPVFIDTFWGTGINPYYVPYVAGVAINYLQEIFKYVPELHKAWINF